MYTCDCTKVVSLQATSGGVGGTEVTIEVTFEPSQLGDSRGTLTVSSGICVKISNFRESYLIIYLANKFVLIILSEARPQKSKILVKVWVIGRKNESQSKLHVDFMYIGESVSDCVMKSR